jgi:hypothetical protein
VRQLRQPGTNKLYNQITTNAQPIKTKMHIAPMAAARRVRCRDFRDLTRHCVATDAGSLTGDQISSVSGVKYSGGAKVT